MTCHSFCSATARAPGTRRTASPAGPTSICPKRGREALEAGRLLKAEGYVFDVAYTSVLKRAIRTLWIALDEIDQMWMPVDAHLAAQRAPLRRAAGAEQGRDRREARRRAGQDLAAQLRHPAAAADARRALQPTIRATPVSPPRAAADRIASRTPSRASCPTGTRRSRRRSSGRARAHRGARQQPARAGEVPRRHLGRRDRRAQHPDRHPAGLRPAPSRCRRRRATSRPRSEPASRAPRSRRRRPDSPDRSRGD